MISLVSSSGGSFALDWETLCVWLTAVAVLTTSSTVMTGPLTAPFTAVSCWGIDASYTTLLLLHHQGQSLFKQTCCFSWHQSSGITWSNSGFKSVYLWGDSWRRDELLHFLLKFKFNSSHFLITQLLLGEDLGVTMGPTQVYKHTQSHIYSLHWGNSWWQWQFTHMIYMTLQWCSCSLFLTCHMSVCC